jgi:hypothetical protein
MNRVDFERLAQRHASVQPAAADLPARSEFSHAIRDLFVTQTFGLVLFGARPMSIALLNTEDTCSQGTSVGVYEQLQRKFKLGASEKYGWGGPVNSHVADKKIAVFFNRERVREIFAEHEAVFRRNFGRMATAETVMNLLSQPQTLWRVLNEHYEVVGILLGFGAYNSQVFEKRSQLRERRLQFDPTLRLETEELSESLEQSVEFYSLPPGCGSLAFLGSKGSESAEIVRGFKETQARVMRFATRLDFDKYILKELTAGV